MNIKSEFRSYRLTRLIIETAPWEKKKAAKIKLREEKAELGRILKLKSRIEEVWTTTDGLNNDDPCKILAEQSVSKQKWQESSHTMSNRVKVSTDISYNISCRNRNLGPIVMSFKRAKTSDDPTEVLGVFVDVNDNRQEKPEIEGIVRVRPLPVPRPRKSPPPCNP